MSHAITDNSVAGTVQRKRERGKRRKVLTFGIRKEMESFWLYLQIVKFYLPNVFFSSCGSYIVIDICLHIYSQ